ncbi:hypothetical protein XFF7767_990035 [Xanthomonas citri pv. fuscans]|nr:hypothetical protein XFF7767_990035 [Xanthomonas citri pv. fuscans]
MKLPMSSSRLDLPERYRLQALYETGMSMRAIASVLERTQHDQPRTAPQPARSAVSA